MTGHRVGRFVCGRPIRSRQYFPGNVCLIGDLAKASLIEGFSAFVFSRAPAADEFVDDVPPEELTEKRYKFFRPPKKTHGSVEFARL